MVARENFGPRVAQIAAVALLIDYVVTVAVQTAAASAIIVSAFPALGRIPGIGPIWILTRLSVAQILIMCYGNLRGIREAGKIVRPADLPVLRLGRVDDHRRDRSARRSVIFISSASTTSPGGAVGYGHAPRACSPSR